MDNFNNTGLFVGDMVVVRLGVTTTDYFGGGGLGVRAATRAGGGRFGKLGFFSLLELRFLLVFVVLDEIVQDNFRHLN